MEHDFCSSCDLQHVTMQATAPTYRCLVGRGGTPRTRHDCLALFSSPLLFPRSFTHCLSVDDRDTVVVRKDNDRYTFNKTHTHVYVFWVTYLEHAELLRKSFVGLRIIHWSLHITTLLYSETKQIALLLYMHAIHPFSICYGCIQSFSELFFIHIACHKDGVVVKYSALKWSRT